MNILDLPLVVALFFVAMLTAGAMAVRSASRIWLRHWVERRLRGSAAALTYLERPQRLLFAAAAGVGATIVFAGALLGVRSDAGTLVWQVVAYAALLMLLGQIVPRALARRWPSAFVPATLPVLRAAELMARPIAALGRAAAKPFEQPAATPVEEERDAIQDLLREGELEGVGEREEIAIITGVVEFGEKVARDVMTPRDEIFAVEAGTDPASFSVAIAQSAYSRVPVYRGSLDDIAGMVHAFDVLKTRGETLPPLRPVAFAGPEAPCNELLFAMLRGRRHLAIVRDANGRTLGLVTLEDLLEELVGDIRDEHDEPEPPRPTNTQ